MTKLTYFDFDLLLEKNDSKYKASVLNSPSGQAVCEFELPFSEMELENFYLKIGRPRRGMRRIDSEEMIVAKKIGKRLFNTLFKDEVLACFRSSLTQARNFGLGLRIRLRIESPELNELPWEFLYSDVTNIFLSLSIGTPIIRYLNLQQPTSTLETFAPIRILAMISSPVNYPKLNTEREWEKLQTAVSDLQRKGIVQIDRLEKGTLSELQRQLRRNEYHVFHFIGHGGFDEREQDGVLVFEKEDGYSHVLSGQHLGTILHNHFPLRLAILNACEGARTARQDPFAGTAQSLVQQGIPAVIAMQFEITDDAAITFSEEFYSALADEYSVDSALSEARAAIFTQGNDIEWGTPVFFTRAIDNKLFSIKQRLPLEEVDNRNDPIGQVINDTYLRDLYIDGLQAFAKKDWEKAVKRFEAIFVVQRDYEDVQERLIEIREQHQAATKTEYDSVNDLYQRALKEMINESWVNAERLIVQIKKTRPGYRDTEELLKVTKDRLSKPKSDPVEPKPKSFEKSSSSIDENKTKPKAKPFTVLPSTLSVKTVGNVSTPILYKGDSLPARYSEMFSTAEDNQNSVEVELLLGENKKASDNKSLGKFSFDGIPPSRKGIPQVELLFIVGMDLMLDVTAIDKAMNRSKNLGGIDLSRVAPPPVKDPIAAKKSPKPQDKQVPSNNYEDIFNDIFQDSYTKPASKAPKRGDDIKLQLNITLEEAFCGIEKKIAFERYELCKTCKGSGRNSSIQCISCQGKGKKWAEKKFTAKIPAGVDTGVKIRFQSLGHCGEYGGIQGDVYIIISVQQHSIFVRDKSNLIINYPITKRAAEQGGVINVPSLKKNNDYQIAIPPNTNDKDSFYIQDAGFVNINNNSCGDIVIVISIYNPREISQEIRGRLDRINKYLGSDVQF